MQQIKQIIIGVDPHKLSATIEVVDKHEQRLGSGRFTTDRAGYAAMRWVMPVCPTTVSKVTGLYLRALTINFSILNGRKLI